MKRTALAIAAGICLFAPGRPLPAPAGKDARDAVFDALASKADLPAVRPVLPSLIAERDALRPDDAGVRAKREKAAKEARRSVRSESAKANASAARSEAARAAGAAKDDARRAAEKVREEKTRKKPKPPKPPRPDGGGSP
ncbi:MAG TPA: hypothetical protein VEB43_09440 [Anaeromyxobacter sp.]|nr:hypothetical protein [Anaeromyxobacter sp.]